MKLIDADKLRERMYHDAFETDTDMQKWDGGCWIRYKMFENAMDSAPTINAEPMWIPCSERLPEVHEEPYYADHEAILHESDHVLTCCKDGGGFVYAIGSVIHDEVCGSYEWSDLYDYADCEIDDTQVLAWMPLPEPYKEEEQ